MSSLYILIPITLALVVLAGWAFFWAVGNGQFDDLDAPGWDALREDPAATRSQSTPSHAARRDDDA